MLSEFTFYNFATLPNVRKAVLPLEERERNLKRSNFSGLALPGIDSTNWQKHLELIIPDARALVRTGLATSDEVDAIRIDPSAMSVRYAFHCPNSTELTRTASRVSRDYPTAQTAYVQVNLSSSFDKRLVGWKKVRTTKL
ncbi:hypothetical protein EVAR_25169_1 [Eumeta japonica]|uniref:Uncharacterized protein n=1 Tax=Eumeta variegata TaxID=151549 RepID=A0A4C1VRN8_EUMVA|nr:hypothetical protein EVAR_25169_1 [Eumeta japonica]